VCTVSAAPALDDATILAHRAVVITDTSMPLQELYRIDALCRSNGISFLYNFCGGVATSIFVDHGNTHTINDADGEKPTTKLIQSITPIDGSTEVLIRYDTPEGTVPTALDEGFFDVSDVTGMGLDDTTTMVEVYHPWKDPAKTVRAKLDPSGRPDYIGGGLLTLKKMPKEISMSSLADKVKSPGNPFMGDMVLTNLIDMGAELQQHVALVSVLTFVGREGRLPRCRDAADTAAVLVIAKEVTADGTVEIPDFELDAAFVEAFASFCGVELQPMAAFTGGVLAQEVVKCTGKFTPIPGWLHFGCKDALPPAPKEAMEEEGATAEAEEPSTAPLDYAPRGSRYDELAGVYGWAFVEKLGSLNYFMVGCGALGCEFLKVNDYCRYNHSHKNLLLLCQSL